MMNFELVDNAMAIVRTISRTTKHSAQELTIGAGHRANGPETPNNLYIGTIDDVRIYIRPLSSSEVQALYLLQE